MQQSQNEQPGIEFSQNFPIKDVEIEYNDENTSDLIFFKLNEKVINSKTLYELLDNISKAQQQLQAFDMYKQVHLKLLPGEEKNCVKVCYDVKKKAPYFGSASHFIDRSGGAMVTVKGGFKNLLGLFDKFSLEYTKSVSKKTQSTYQFQMELPDLLSDIDERNWNFSYAFKKQMIDKYINEGNRSFQAVYNMGENQSITFENSLRINQFGLDGFSDQSAFYFNKKEFLPSNKISTQISKVLENTVEMDPYRQPVLTGKMRKSLFEMTVPVLSDTQFIKYEYMEKRYHDLDIYQDKCQALKYCNLETNFAAGFVTSLFYKKLHQNDCFLFNSMRGFNDLHTMPLKSQVQDLNQQQVQEQHGSHIKQILNNNCDLYLKQSFKLNLYNNFEKNPGVNAFLHGSFGYFQRLRNNQYLKQNNGNLFNMYGLINKGNFRASSGVGVALNIGQGTGIEFMYNFLHYGRISDSISKFQLRVSIND